MRGLKHRTRQQDSNEYDEVAPHAGAWIETLMYAIITSAYQYVAPHAGAWIETGIASRLAARVPVAPHAGAWIETSLAG